MSLQPAKRRQPRKLKYVDADGFFELVTRSGKTERDFCDSAGVSGEVFFIACSISAGRSDYRP
jgi:hypothetical protein